jgi:very-short-patch-repair endonuclease
MDGIDAKSKSFAKQLRKQLTNAETILWSRLRRDSIQGRRFRRQHPIGPYVADFACMPIRLVIELDGETHSSPKEQKHDRVRDRYLNEHGWHVVRIWNGDVFENLDGVLEMIHNAVIARKR